MMSQQTKDFACGYYTEAIKEYEEKIEKLENTAWVEIRAEGLVVVESPMFFELLRAIELYCLAHMLEMAKIGKNLVGH